MCQMYKFYENFMFFCRRIHPFTYRANFTPFLLCVWILIVRKLKVTIIEFFDKRHRNCGLASFMRKTISILWDFNLPIETS